MRDSRRSPVWVVKWILRLLGLLKRFPQRWHRCRLSFFFALPPLAPSVPDMDMSPTLAEAVSRPLMMNLSLSAPSKLPPEGERPPIGRPSPVVGSTARSSLSAMIDLLPRFGKRCLADIVFYGVIETWNGLQLPVTACSFLQAMDAVRKSEPTQPLLTRGSYK